MTKFGVHSLVFGDVWDEAHAKAACRSAVEIGYDLIEVLVFDPSTLDVAMTARVAKEAGIGVRLGMALGAGDDIASPDAATAARGEATVARCLEIAAELGAPGVSGITYAAFNSYAAPPTEAQRDQVVASLARLDKRAGELGVRLGLEPVNRYESYLVNTLDEGAGLIRAAGAANLFLHMDTFHMNIEEGDFAAAIHRNADFLGYAHVADNNRALLGAGNFDLTGYFRALASAGYQGDYTVESFSPKVLTPGLTGGLRLWRCAWDDPIQAAKMALQVMQTGVAAAKAGVTVW
jgi:D-psicose/D-tagatose/L-ribulose 3-epimerase